MKCLHIFILLLGFTTTSFSKNKYKAEKFYIRGTIQGLRMGKIFISYTDCKRNDKSESSIILNGRFKFKGSIAFPTKASLSLNPNNRKTNDPDYCEFYIEPKVQIVLISKNNFKNIKLIVLINRS